MENEVVFLAKIVSFQYLNISPQCLEIYILQVLGKYTDPNTSNEERGLTSNRGSLVCKQNVYWRRSRTELDRLVFQPLA